MANGEMLVGGFPVDQFTPGVCKLHVVHCYMHHGLAWAYIPRRSDDPIVNEGHPSPLATRVVVLELESSKASAMLSNGLALFLNILYLRNQNGLRWPGFVFQTPSRPE